MQTVCITRSVIFFFFLVDRSMWLSTYHVNGIKSLIYIPLTSYRTRVSTIEN